MTDLDRYRIKQDGMVVARAEGQHALREIMHYAAVYGQDGPVSIERAKGKRWAKFGEIVKDSFPTSPSAVTISG